MHRLGGALVRWVRSDACTEPAQGGPSSKQFKSLKNPIGERDGYEYGY